MSITSIYLIYLICSTYPCIYYTSGKLKRFNTLLLRHPYLWMWSTPTDPEPKFRAFRCLRASAALCNCVLSRLSQCWRPLAKLQGTWRKWLKTRVFVVVVVVDVAVVVVVMVILITFFFYQKLLWGNFWLGGSAGFLPGKHLQSWCNPKIPISQTSLSPYKTLPVGPGTSSNQNASQVAGQSGKALQHFVEKLAFDHHQSLWPLLQFHSHRRSLALLKHTPHIESGRFQKLCHLNSETSAFLVGGWNTSVNLINFAK